MSTARELRVKLNIAQEELARRAGVGYQTVIRWEKGLPVRPSVAEKLAAQLGAPLDEIAGISLYSAVLARNKGVIR